MKITLKNTNSFGDINSGDIQRDFLIIEHEGVAIITDINGKKIATLSMQVGFDDNKKLAKDYYLVFLPANHHPIDKNIADVSP